MMVNRARLLLLGLAGMLMAAGTASAQTSGFTFAAEGGVGYRPGEMMTPFSYQPVPSVNLDGPGAEWVTPDIANRLVATGRLEVAATAAGPGGAFVRFSAVAAGWLGSNGLQRDAWGAEAVRFENTDAGQHSVTHAQVCRAGAAQPPCTAVDGRLVEAYHEVMPGIFIGHGFGNGGFIAIGAQPFAGWLTERGYSAVGFTSSTSVFADRIDGRALGILGTAEANIPVGQRMHLLLTGGGGSYSIAARSLIEQYSLTNGVVTTTLPDTIETTEVRGFRFQGGLGLTRRISDRVELGVMTRTDFWTAFPRMAWIYINPAICDSKSDNEGHTVTHCQAGKPEGEHGLAVAPLSVTSIGIRLTLQLGD